MKNFNGFSAIEVMITMALAMAALWGISTFVLDMGRSYSESAQKYELMEIKTNLYSAMNNKDSCAEILSSLNGPLTKGQSIPIDKIVATRQDLNLKKDQIIQNSIFNLKVKSMEFKVIDSIQGINNHILGQYEIHLSGPGKTPFVPIKIRQVIKTDVSGAAESCIFETIPSCPSGELLSGIDQSGMPICLSLECPQGQVLKGLLPSGQPICVDDNSIAQRTFTCPIGQYINGVDSAGQVKCN